MATTIRQRMPAAPDTFDAGRAQLDRIADRLHLDAATRPAYNTVLTIMKILERKGYVAHEKQGRAFRYVPLIDSSQARQTAVSHLISRFFNGSSEALVLDLLGPDRVSDDERRQVRELLNRTAKATGADPSREAPGSMRRKAR